MASGINLAILVGNLGRDPELRYTGEGKPVCTMSLATNESWVDKEGERHDRTEWHRIVVWGGQAESCDKYLHKGSQVAIEGSIRTRSWEDRDGNRRRTTEIDAKDVLFLSDAGPRDDSGHGGRDEPERPAEPEAPSDEGLDDSVPF
jgi:single-strand DNA-binding protein